MHSIDQAIEDLQDKAEKLEQLKDHIQEELSAAAAVIAEGTRARMAEACDDIEMDIDYDVLDELDVDDLRNEMHEELSDMVRYY